MSPPRRSRPRLVGLELGAVLSGVVALAPAVRAEPPAKIRGIVVSTHTDGREWGSDAMGPTLDAIASLGANWIAFHPYGWIRDDGEVRFPVFDPQRPPAQLVRPIREAHARGLKVLVKPHLGYWGSRFSWRGAIAFETDEAWQRFFASYRRWIVALAVACREADGFCVGTELDGTVARAAAWREVIASVRGATKAPLTYAANWDTYEGVPFWDALDTVGIQAYFPVGRAGAASDALRAAWRGRLRELAAFSSRTGRPIVFTELGYTRSRAAPERPWASLPDEPEAEPYQALLLRVALEAIETEPAVIGVFLWKWFPEPRPVGRDFQLATPRLKHTIASVWRGRSEQGPRAD